MMLERLNEWSRRVGTSSAALAPLGFGMEYWKTDAKLYEGYEQLATRTRALGRGVRKLNVVYELVTHLLNDVLVAAGGVESAVLRLRGAVAELQAYASKHQPCATPGVPHGLGHPAVAVAWYAFSDLLTWSRTVVERMERPAGDRRRFPPQGLLPALKPKRLRKRCEVLLKQLRDGPVGQSRPLANFVLHTALVRHPQSGVKIDTDGSIVLPVPDLPRQRVAHWYLFTWQSERDGLVFAEEIWQAVQSFVDSLLSAFEKAVPSRLRRQV